MKEKILMDLGLSKNESKIYISLLETGFATATKIAEASKIHRVNVYDSINKLRNKGLVGEVSDSGKKCYQAAPPETLRNIIKEKEMRLNKIIPELELSNKISQEKYEVQVFQGYGFIRNLFLHFLEKGDDIYDLNVPCFAVSNLGEDFQKIIHKRRAGQKQHMYHIYNKLAVDRMKFLNTLPYTEAKYLDQDFKHNVSTIICGDEIAIRIFHESKSSKPLIIHIKNRQIAETYKDQFMALWKKAKIPS